MMLISLESLKKFINEKIKNEIMTYTKAQKAHDSYDLCLFEGYTDALYAMEAYLKDFENADLINIEALKDFIEHESIKASEMYFYSNDIKNYLDKAYYEGYGNAVCSMSDFLKDFENGIGN